jgi:hypothetical protein
MLKAAPSTALYDSGGTIRRRTLRAEYSQNMRGYECNNQTPGARNRYVILCKKIMRGGLMLMSIFTELIIRGVLVITLNDGIILYVIKKRSTPITIPIILGIILVTSVAFVINTWYCLKKNGII